MHFGIISPPVPGHVHPFGALGRELISRGHRVTLIQMADLEQKAGDEELGFTKIGGIDHPRGSLPLSLQKLGRLKGLAALKFTIQAVKRTTEMICRDAPGAIRDQGINALLVDQTEPAGATVADHLGLPFITVCNALALNREPDAPPPFTNWSYGPPSFWRRAANRAGYAVFDRTLSPVTKVVSSYRKRWGLRPYASPEDSFSSLAQICQQPEAFDFPRQSLPECFHYVGPLRRSTGTKIPFPWEKLSDRPLVYASLGTLQKSPKLFRFFAEACDGLGVQLVLSHCGSLDEEAVRMLPGQVTAVPYAPQEALLARAALTLTHAGLNTVLDSLTYGVPLVAIPLTYEQPATAARISWSGVGQVVKFEGLNPRTLRTAVKEVLENGLYRTNAQKIAQSIERSGGVIRAADLVEEAIPEAARKRERATPDF